MNESGRSPRVRRGGSVQSAQRNRRTLINQPERMSQLRRMVEDDVSMKEISRTMGIHRNTIKRYFPDAGWSIGAPSGIKQLRKLERAVFGEG